MLPKAVVINGNGIDEELLKEIGIEHVESFVPLTGIDEENILLTLHAKDVSDAKVITKVNRITFNNVISSLDLGSVIYPKYITSEAIVAFVRAKSASMNSNIETLAHLKDDRAEAVEFVIGEKARVVGVPIKDLTLKENLLIACINRNGQVIIPGGNDEMKAGDSVIIVTTIRGLTDIEDILR